jgi:hypothetical protein
VKRLTEICPETSFALADLLRPLTAAYGTYTENSSREKLRFSERSCDHFANLAASLLEELESTCRAALLQRNSRYRPGLTQIDVQRAQPGAVTLVPQDIRWQHGDEIA